MLNSNTKKKSVGFGSAIIGTLIVIGAVAAYAVISLLICRIFFSTRLGSDVAAALWTAWTGSIGIAFVLYEIVFAIMMVKKSMEASERSEAQLMGKIFKISLLAAATLSVLLAIFTANTYTELREDSISKVCFVTTNEYRWDSDNNDVYSYTLDCDENGALSFSVKMDDGTTVGIFDSLNTVSDGFKEKYSTDKLAFVAYAASLSDQFDSNGHFIEKKITGKDNMEKLYNTESNAEIWQYLSDIIE